MMPINNFKMKNAQGTLLLHAFPLNIRCGIYNGYSKYEKIKMKNFTFFPVPKAAFKPLSEK